MRRQLLCAVLLLFAGLASFAQQPAAQPGRAVLVELFTSEGCSSCPPADELLRRIDGYRVQTGQRVVALSEHVTYWNSPDGWADPFSQELFTARQNAYGDRFGLRSVYTPQMVVNGEREMVGSNGPAVLQALSASGRTMPVTVQIGSVEVSGHSVAIHYAVTGEARGAEIFAAIADDMATSEVPRGENAGRTLRHVSVARSLVRVGSVHGAAGLRTVTVALPDELKGRAPGRRHVVLFAQAPGFGEVLSVDTRPL